MAAKKAMSIFIPSEDVENVGLHTDVPRPRRIRLTVYKRAWKSIFNFKELSASINLTYSTVVYNGGIRRKEPIGSLGLGFREYRIEGIDSRVKTFHSNEFPVLEKESSHYTEQP